MTPRCHQLKTLTTIALAAAVAWASPAAHPENPPEERYIVQAADLREARSAVQDVGGYVTHESR